MRYVIRELDRLIKDTKRIRSAVIDELREMDPKDLAALEDNDDGHGRSRLVRKVHGYPTDLSLTRLRTVMMKKEESK